MVLTACSTAAASPNGEHYPGTAFEGLAQSLIERQWGPSAVIAMQFDFGSEASAIFSGALYEKLLRPRSCLDEAVTAARVALAGHFGSGHRAWVTPTVYWRCKNAQAFEFLEIESQSTGEQRGKLMAIEAQQDLIFDELEEISRQPPEIRVALESAGGSSSTRSSNSAKNAAAFWVRPCGCWRLCRTGWRHRMCVGAATANPSQHRRDSRYRAARPRRVSLAR